MLLDYKFLRRNYILDTFFTVLIAILVFGFLIFIHEFGHYITARMFKVTVKEFCIGMGPKLIYWDSKKTGTRYAIAIFPIGGYVAMAGEDEESDDPNSFDKKPAWQRFIITAAGATVNIVTGFLAMILIVAIMGLGRIGGTTVADFLTPEDYVDPDSIDMSHSMSEKIEIGDTILKVNGKRVVLYDELYYEVMRQGYEPCDLTVLRDGEELLIEDVQFPKVTEQGQVFGIADIVPYRVEYKFGSIFSVSFRKACLVMRTCWESIYDLITGRYSLSAVSGPVGISGAIGDAARQGFTSLLNIAVIISINLGFMNLLPIPALDGGRLLVLLIEMITRKRLPVKVEAMINGVGLILLLLLSAVIMVKDVIQLI